MAPTPSVPGTPVSSPILQLRPEDPVGVARRAVEPGETLPGPNGPVTARDRIPFGHKVALAPLRAGEPVCKYGQIIGFASRDIAPGAHVHVHNLEAGSFSRDYAFSTRVPPPPPVADTPRTFKGYRREDGRVATRNYLAVLSTVNCSASVSKSIAARFPREALERFPEVDGVIAVTHKTGCGLQYGGEDHAQLSRTLAGFARHPNIAGYVIVGLGCEVGQASHLVETQRLVQVSPSRSSAVSTAAGTATAPAPPLILTIQDSGGVARTVEAGVKAVMELLPRTSRLERVDIPASELILGLQCGGSDGQSGITANPALGVASDLLVAQGGAAVLAETTEIYGAEHLLTARAVTPAVGQALVDRIRWWEWYTSIFGAEINNNPSPGNKEGGLTTIYEKSLGAIAKGGSTALKAVYRYAEAVTERGLVVMDTPGYDPVSMTGLVAGGANVCVFTTGRGSVYGCKPSPCIKVSTNTPLYRRMEPDMDLDAGVILDGVPVEVVGRQIFEMILRVASGEKTKSELQGLGEEEFAPWSVGPTL